MIRLLELIVPGQPIAKMRPRVTSRGAYNPQTEIERAVQWEIKRQLPKDFTPLPTPLIVAVDAFFPRPKKHYGIGRNQSILKPSAPRFHTHKPDHDNIIKFYLDCMNKLVFVDDTQIVGIANCGKYWIKAIQPGYTRIQVFSVN